MTVYFLPTPDVWDGGSRLEQPGIWGPRVCCQLWLGPFLRPLSGQWSKGPGCPEGGELDTPSFSSWGGDFALNFVPDFQDRSYAAMPSCTLVPNGEEILLPLLPLNRTNLSKAKVAVVWAATQLGKEDIAMDEGVMVSCNQIGCKEPLKYLICTYEKPTLGSTNPYKYKGSKIPLSI